MRAKVFGLNFQFQTATYIEITYWVSQETINSTLFNELATEMSKLCRRVKDTIANNASLCLLTIMNTPRSFSRRLLSEGELFKRLCTNHVNILFMCHAAALPKGSVSLRNKWIITTYKELWWHMYGRWPYRRCMLASKWLLHSTMVDIPNRSLFSDFLFYLWLLETLTFTTYI